VVRRTLTVTRLGRPTPNVVRLVLTGPDLEGFQSEAPDDHIKVFLPNPDPQAERPVMRDYTPRRHDPDAGELEIDVVLHGDGPVSTWAEKAAVGDTLTIGGPRGSLVVEDTFDWYLLVGDDSALPAIARRLAELLPEATVLAFIEVDGPDDEQPLPTATDATIHWIHRDGDAPGTGGRLERAVREATFPEGEWFGFVAAETEVVHAVRTHLLEERGANRDWLGTSGYWKRGVADHHD
jgi:NADPH-dependent ferric siderophore reductase